jgi:hypothetical protein
MILKWVLRVFPYTYFLWLIIAVCDYCGSPYTLATNEHPWNIHIAANDIAQQQTEHNKESYKKTHNT